MSLILGINAYNHNSSVTLLRDGKIVFAAEEERFNRVKNSDAFPVLALQSGLDLIGAQAGEIDAVGYCWDWKLGVKPRLRAALLRVWDPVSVYYISGADRIGRLGRIGGIEREMRAAGLANASFHRVPHHYCHAATAFLASPYESAAVLSVDGVGEWATTWMGMGQGLNLTQTGERRFPHSLGLAYDAVTEFVGFDKRSGAGKTMGLAAYGDPKRFERFFAEWIVLLDDGGFAVRSGPVTWHRYFGYGGVPLFSKQMEEVLGKPCAKSEIPKQHHADVAAGMQRRFEEVMLHMARHLWKSTGMISFVVGWGCGFNCSDF
jgi:carbamoyltransferase